jgi:hypothetical protein
MSFYTNMSNVPSKVGWMTSFWNKLPEHDIPFVIVSGELSVDFIEQKICNFEKKP